jgi:hypothetical protein
LAACGRRPGYWRFKGMLKTGLAPFAAALGLWLVAASTAQAQSAHRAWVSGHGTDSAGCGAPTAPCRSLQYTHDHVVAAGGEIDILDPAGYGALNITKAISVINDGVGTAGVQATSGNAITINAASSAAVILRGLDIEGVGAADGIRFTAGGTLTVQDCTMNGFLGAGLLYEPKTSGYLFVSNSRVTNNVNYGIDVFPLINSGTATVLATISRIEAVNDGLGVNVDSTSSGQDVNVSVALTDSVMSNNSSAGAASGASLATTFLMVRNSTLANNHIGVLQGGGGLDVGHSMVTGNVTAFFGLVDSYGDNEVDGNGSLGSTPTIVAFH